MRYIVGGAIAGVVALVVGGVMLALLLPEAPSAGNKQTKTAPEGLALTGPKRDVWLGGKAVAHVSSPSDGEVVLLHNGQEVERKSFGEGKSAVPFPQPKDGGKYRFQASAGDESASSEVWRTRYPSFHSGAKGANVLLYHRLLRQVGYNNAPKGKSWNEYSELATMAFRKTNGLAFSGRASRRVWQKLLRGEGAFPLRHKTSGKHVEVNLRLQTMALAKGGEVIYTYHISSGAPATPSDLGKYYFYSKLPGSNALGMYYTVFYNRGEGTHGYYSVPPYAASHGCIRNPIPSSIQIYNWIPIGAPIWVYY